MYFFLTKLLDCLKNSIKLNRENTRFCISPHEKMSFTHNSFFILIYLTIHDRNHLIEMFGKNRRFKSDLFNKITT